MMKKMELFSVAKRIALYISMLALIAGCSNEAPKWVEVGNTSDMHFYMAKAASDSRVKAPMMVVNMLWDYNYPQIRSEGEYMSVVVTLLIDCTQAKAADFAYTNYSKNMASGSVIARGERDIKAAMYDMRELLNPSTKEVAVQACRQYQ